MATGVGLHIAEHVCAAAVVGDGADPYFILREPVLHMSDDGDAVLGGTHAPPDHTHTITGFVAAVGDPAGVVVDDGEAFRGEDLLATALFCLINLTAEYLHGAAEFYATHPAGWPVAQVLALRGALDYLGLKTVTLISEDDLPAPPAGLTTAERGSYFAESAGRAALAVVLDTPAGATPPDPTTAENSFLDTIVMPKLRGGDTPAKAYSAISPAMDPEATYGGPSLGVLAAGLGVPAAERPATSAPAAAVPAVAPATGSRRVAAKAAAPEPPARPVADRSVRRTAGLVAAAALGGVVIGAVGVAVLLGRGSAEPGTPPAPTTTETPAASPVPPPVLPQPLAPPPVEPTYELEPTYEPEPTYAEPPPPPVTVTPTPVPTTTGTPDATRTPGPTLTEPTTGTETPTTKTRPSNGFEFFPFPMPFPTDENPEMDLPDTGSKEGRQEEAR
ncbi:hypothetical protein [Nocardia sp. NPDC024068]|uniref:hypothetical protein n=1 Tax=Nocardia sp. NPDC024068 TaxID=3157197 RepID=UPI0034045DB9